MASMQFWGVAVKAKEPCKVSLEEGHVIHLSQVTLSEIKKDNEPITIHVKVNDKKLVLGLLNQTIPQLSFDLVFDTDFEISHNWKNGSIHLLGYKTELPDESDMFSESSDEEEDVNLPVLPKLNGNVAAPAAAPVAAQAAKPKVEAKASKDNKPKPEENDDSDEDDSDDDDDDSDVDSDEAMFSKSEDSGDEDEDEDEDDSSSEDEQPAKSASGKKRPNADAKTPESKKAKLVTPQKTDGKKGGVHTATPHPSKKGGKTPAGDKSTTKSGGQASCGSCKKSFSSDTALQSHNKAKHSAK